MTIFVDFQEFIDSLAVGLYKGGVFYGTPENLELFSAIALRRSTSRRMPVHADGPTLKDQSPASFRAPSLQ